MRKSNVPSTSKEALESLDPETMRDIYKRILWALSQIGEGHYEDIAIALKEKESRVWKRLKELSDMNLIYRTENKKVLSSGRKGYTWKATLQGSPTIQDHSRNIESISRTATVRQQNLF
jgi:predicted transcriptional regulator